MTEKKERLGWLALAAFVGLCLGGWLGRTCNHFRGVTEKMDTVVVKDTVRVTEPRAVDSVVTGVIRVPIVVDGHDGHIGLDGLDGRDDAVDVQNVGKIGVSDTVWATVPRTQKRYEDSTYTAWVSGYEARLDSIEVYRKTMFVTKTQTVTKRNRFSVGLTGGVGYGVFTRKPDVWVGVGVTLRLF